MANKAMTKAQLVSLIANKINLTKVTANDLLDLVAKTAVTETKKNGQFVIPGIGKLVKSQRKARVGRNPQTGAAIKIPAKTVVKFRVAKACKDAVAPGRPAGAAKPKMAKEADLPTRVAERFRSPVTSPSEADQRQNALLQ